jgi:hypothetical protein
VFEGRPTNFAGRKPKALRRVGTVKKQEKIPKFGIAEAVPERQALLRGPPKRVANKT